MNLNYSDNQTFFSFDNEKDAALIKTKELTRKTASGDVVPTGVTQTEFVIRRTKSQLEAGEGIKVQNEDGSISLVSEIKFVTKQMDADAIEKAGQAKRYDNLVKDVRRFLGVSKSAKAIAESDKLTPKDVMNWMDGKRTVKGYQFDSLPEAVQNKVGDILDEYDKKQAGKPLTMTQLSQLFLEAAQQGVEIDPKYVAQFEALKAKTAKLKGKGGENATA